MKRFYDKVMFEPNTGCWLWTASTNKDNYGYFRVGDKMEKAHRVSYKLHIGEIDNGLEVCHKCDVPQCVCPDHLFLASHAENMQDMVYKNRSSKEAKTQGITHGMSKLTDEQVRGIRKDARLLREIAADYGMSIQQISRIRNRKLWRHVG